jgi:hypothetical protein
VYVKKSSVWVAGWHPNWDSETFSRFTKPLGSATATAAVLPLKKKAIVSPKDTPKNKPTPTPTGRSSPNDRCSRALTSHDHRMAKGRPVAAPIMIAVPA